MNDIFLYLNEREQEFQRHCSIAKMLEQRLDDTFSEGEMYIEVSHVNTIKSGLLVHLYNIVEAVSTRTLKSVGQYIASESPKVWTNLVLHEWVRYEFWNKDQNADTALSHLTSLSSKLLKGGKAEVFNIKSATGSWDDKDIKTIARRLGCDLELSSEVRRAAYEKKYRDNKNSLEYLSLRRNAIAHGSSTFEDGAKDLTLMEILELSNRIIPYLKEVTKSYELFIQNKKYIKEEEVA